MQTAYTLLPYGNLQCAWLHADFKRTRMRSKLFTLYIVKLNCMFHCNASLWSMTISLCAQIDAIKILRNLKCLINNSRLPWVIFWSKCGVCIIIVIENISYVYTGGKIVLKTLNEIFRNLLKCFITSIVCTVAV